MAASYFNTDLNLKGRFDLRPLVRHLESRGLVCLGEPTVQGGVWYAVLETALDRSKPDQVAERLLGAVEGLEGEFRLAWDRCLVREFDLGFGCEGGDFESTTPIGNDLLRRIASTGAALKITIYRESEPTEGVVPDTEAHS